MATLTEMIKELRERTGAGMLECKNALREAGDDVDKAIELLREKGMAKADKKAGRATTEGLVGSYVHQTGKIGVLVEVACETDFVARTDDFQQFVSELALHIAASAPLAVDEDGIDPEVLAAEERVFREQALQEGKPENVVDMIVDGRLRKFKQETVLMSQEYVRDPDMTIEDLLKETIGKLGENIVIRRFARFELGQ